MAVVYIHRRLDDYSVFYVGIGKLRRRAYNTISRNIHWKRVFEKFGREVEIIKENIDWNEACELEKLVIELLGTEKKGNGRLVNMTDGGEGTCGIIVNEDTRLKMRNAKIGRRLTDEHKQKIGLESKNRKRLPMSEEQKEKLSAVHSGKKLTAEHKKNIGLKSKGNKYMLGRKLSMETRAKMSASLIIRHANNKLTR